MTLGDFVAANIRSLRVEQRLTQTDLAERASLSVSYVCMLERGQRTPPLDTLEVLGQALQVSPLRLLEPVEEGHRITDMRRYAARRRQSQGYSTSTGQDQPQCRTSEMGFRYALPASRPRSPPTPALPRSWAAPEPGRQTRDLWSVTPSG